ncbi:uncharacterized protein LOC117221066 isoform X2 [Megalopta genalis]|uniref:uncharacterized protein LOC117221066 isoform X2 n=1 Tax=Megalopta genalis TaxID=115081 RepID=UPI003FD2818C
MNAFRENYKTYYSLMNAAGLWPHDRTVLAWIRRVAFGLLAASLVVNQIMTLRNLEPTLYDFTVLISYCTPILMYNIRYVSSILTFPTIKYVLNSLEHDYVTLKDPMELKILMRHSLLAKRIVQMYVALTCSGLLFIIATLGVPTIQRSDRQLRSLYVTGYFFNERSIHSNLTCLHIILGSIHGLTSFICTEGTLTVFSTYVSGLLDVASYRMQNAVGDAASSNETDVLKIRPAVEMHRRAIVSIFIAITELGDADDIMFSMQLFVAQLAYICGNNLSGQLVLDRSAKIINDIYNSPWYRLSPKLQKMILFTLMKSQTLLKFNFVGLFTPCFEGFSTMMSTAFSYFTLLCSVH